MGTRTTEETAERVVSVLLARLDDVGYYENVAGRRVLMVHAQAPLAIGPRIAGLDALRTLVREELERP